MDVNVSAFLTVSDGLYDIILLFSINISKNFTLFSYKVYACFTKIKFYKPCLPLKIAFVYIVLELNYCTFQKSNLIQK